ncbi:hypothetical protein bmyco0002_19640 [Bacillus pseudomycoides]|uniref:hypothetical protein n=1 Tax=Bacillus TaxID=1386 RepID=UPI0001A158A2|nr:MULTISPECIES: hypothetical protein [Bacillus]EEM05544.1 hypothetical protein bmyco0002_19640 [Bacillus pseudomycoides]PGC30288.1 hypothetical protein COM18_28880 [Bacillus pseudomycoides]
MEQKELELLKEVELLIAGLEPLFQLRGRMVDESTARGKGGINDEDGMDFDKLFSEVYKRTGSEIVEVTERFYISVVKNFKWWSLILFNTC